MFEYRIRSNKCVISRPGASAVGVRLLTHLADIFAHVLFHTHAHTCVSSITRHTGQAAMRPLVLLLVIHPCVSCDVLMLCTPCQYTAISMFDLCNPNKL